VNLAHRIWKKEISALIKEQRGQDLQFSTKILTHPRGQLGA